MAVPLGDLASRHDGERTVILGNGPSLNRTPLHLLSNERVWTSNRAYLLFDRIGWRPSFHVVVDPNVIANSTQALSECIATLPRTLFFVPADVRGLPGLEEAPNVCMFAFADTGADFADGRANMQPAKSATVAVVCMQLAAILGFRKILLSGFDMDYRNGVPESSGTGPGRFTFTGERDADHFHPGYLDRDAIWTVPQVPQMLRDFGEIGRQFEAAGIDVANATVGGALECYRRVDLAAGLSRSD